MQLNMNIENPYGVLLNEHDIKLHRQWFAEMCEFWGVKTIYRAPRPGKQWTTYGEIDDNNYYEPQIVSCVFNEHPEQRTMKKLGWVSELDESASIISVPYDLPELQVGALFIVPSAINPKIGRLFRVVKMSTAMIYPASITCEIVPEYENTETNDLFNHTHNSMPRLNREEEFDR